MYAICRPTTPVNRDDIKDEVEWALKYGTYNPVHPPPLRVLAFSPDYSTASRIAASLADRDQKNTEVRSMTMTSGISDTPLHTAVPPPTTLQEEIDAALANGARLDPYDGVPADTGSV